MKKLIKNSILLAKLVFILFIMVSANETQSQNFTSDIQLNMNLTAGEQLNDGRNLISVHNNHVYSVWCNEIDGTIYLSHSDNGGNSFMTESMVNTDTANFFPGLHVADNGDIFVSYSNIDMNAGELNGLILQKSTDNGQSFSTPDTIVDFGIFPIIGSYQNNVYIMYCVPVGGFSTADFYLITSTDNGNSFGSPVKINDAPTEYTRLEDVAHMCIDDAGTIYMVWNDGGRLNAGGDIYFAKSIDAGASITTNIPVNDTLSLYSDSTQFSPGIDVYDNNVYVVWRENSDLEKILFAKSDNGGTSFSGEEIIFNNSDKSPVVCVNSNNEVYVAGDWHTTSHGLHCVISEPGGINFSSAYMISDGNEEPKTPSVTIDQNDTLHFVWTDNRNSNQDIFYSKGRINSGVFIEKEQALNTKTYPNPFVNELNIEINSNVSAVVDIKLYDVHGKLIIYKSYSNLNMGANTLNLNTKELNKGIYFMEVLTPHAYSVSKICKY